MHIVIQQISRIFHLAELELCIHGTSPLPPSPLALTATIPLDVPKSLAISGASCKWNRAVVGMQFCGLLILPRYCSQGPSTLSRMTELPFLRPDNVLLYVYVTFYLPIFLLTDIEGASVSRLLWVKLQWTLSAHISLQDSVFNSGRFIPQSGLLDHVIIPFLIFWGTSVLVFIVVAPFYTLTNSTQGFLLLSIRVNTCYFLCLV